MTGLSARLAPSVLQIELYPAKGKSEATLWHKMSLPNGMKITLTSTSEDVKIIRMSVKSSTIGWNTYWPHWSYAIRLAPELLGGGSVDAQDMLNEEGNELHLLVLPGEDREVTLDFFVTLDGDTFPGDYRLDVEVVDVTNGEEADSCTLPALLQLRHGKSTFLDMLPSLYREACSKQQENDARSLAFFERYLLGFEDCQRQIEKNIDQIPELFAPFMAPSDFLPWLASWVGLVLDDNWSQMKRRRLISEAVELYRWRGTRRGLSRYLEIYAGVWPEIDDQPFEGMRLGEKTLLGINTVLGDVPKHTFVVTIALPNPNMINEQTVRDIIEAEKPAHTAYTLRIVRRDTPEEETIST